MKKAKKGNNRRKLEDASNKKKWGRVGCRKNEGVNNNRPNEKPLIKS